MTFAEAIHPEIAPVYAPPRAPEDVRRTTRLVLVTSTDTQVPGDKPFRYSSTVRRRLLVGATLVFLSGATSLAGEVFEVRSLAYAGAVLLALGLIALTSWISRAHVERKI